MDWNKARTVNHMGKDKEEIIECVRAKLEKGKSKDQHNVEV